MHKLIPSLDTPRQLTRFSWPWREPTFSPRVMSHTCDRISTSFQRLVVELWICRIYLALEVIVTGEEQTPRHGGGNRGNAAEDRFRLLDSWLADKVQAIKQITESESN